MKIEGKEADYLKGANEPLAGSILISNSRYLNNPRFRDIYAQMGLKRNGHDLPAAYLVPASFIATSPFNGKLLSYGINRSG